MPEEFELLKYLHKEQRDELSYRRSREIHIFGWSNAILLAITGAMLVASPKEHSIFAEHMISARVIATILVLGLTIFSVVWQMYQCKCASMHKKVLANLTQRLGCFDGAAPLYPRKWKDWGQRYTKFSEQMCYPSKVSATFLSGIVTLVSLWIGFIL